MKIVTTVLISVVLLGRWMVRLFSVYACREHYGRNSKEGVSALDHVLKAGDAQKARRTVDDNVLTFFVFSTAYRKFFPNTSIPVIPFSLRLFGIGTGKDYSMGCED
ncbi:hypothetical protein [Lacimicrobium alkaliphilum]|uniref:Uncharacterized protein n=1 Tax=Lacimicrobium alkaliphilum TaxID=1526571 RepID=A0A0U2RPY9_9ALTE|nr:hypothetical protein [Lacimicrobium alkaliphilum]ALS99434.1 hypothetical protein AT746_14990 [Lacimicrobium alkaliphilum]